MFDFSFRQLQSGFLDAERILSDVRKAERKVQAKFGAFTRRRMQTSIRYRKQAAAPGEPPSAHASIGFTREKKNKRTGTVSRQPKSPLRELIFFALDPETDSVVIGPVSFGKGVAGLIEKGGAGSVNGKPAIFAPHPFAEPAGRAEAAKLPELLRNMVK